MLIFFLYDIFFDILLVFQHKKFLYFFVTWYKNGKKDLIFGKKCINRNAFHKNKRPISIVNVDIRRIVFSRKDLYGKKGSFKYFIGYISETNAFPMTLCIKLSQMNIYIKCFDSNNKCINLLVYDRKLVKNTMKY